MAMCLPVLELNKLMMSVSGKGLLSLGVWKGSPCPWAATWLGVGELQKSKAGWLWMLQPEGGPTSFRPLKQVAKNKCEYFFGRNLLKMHASSDKFYCAAEKTHMQCCCDCCNVVYISPPGGRIA